ncbi:MAG: DUF420 domain-containing protein [Acidobacteria bacterium]|nr:DUF420 domain-containing protein [Acidobacteriota bacterium]
MQVSDFPALNACLNATSFLLLMLGVYFIKNGRREAHKKAMLGACAVSVLFLSCYLIYHFQVGSVRFERQGWIRTVYLSILLTHTVLAATVPVLVVVTLRRAFRGEFALHRRIARWTFPIWAYVSVTGVVVYLMLYQM